MVLKNATKKFGKLTHLTSKDRADDLRFQKIQIAVQKGIIAITQVTSDLVKLKNNRELTVKDIRKSTFPVIKTSTEAMKLVNQEADSIRRTNTARSLPKDLYPLTKDVPIPSECLFVDDIIATINNSKAQRKAFKVDKT